MVLVIVDIGFVVVVDVDVGEAPVEKAGREW